MRFTTLHFAAASVLALLPSAIGCGSDTLTGGTTSGDVPNSTTGSSSTTASSSSSGAGGMGGAGGMSSSSGTGGMGTGGGSSTGTGGMGTGGGNSTGTGGMGTGSGSSTGTGGMMGDCTTVGDCLPTGNVCITATCIANQCGTAMVPSGTAIATQTPGNCHAEVCDGNGAITSAIDNADVPKDGKACTSDVCTAGVASNPSLPQGTTCGAGLVCDGNGACLGCNAASDCPGMDTACQSRTCTAGACGLAFQPVGTAIPTQIAGDCKIDQCNGAGAVVSVNDNNDASSDGNACTADTCVNGAPAHPALMSGAACATGGGVVCNGAGVCVQCVTSANCTSGVCVNNACETCTDGVKDGSESGVDCGGSACPSCGLGQPCMISPDCASGVCTANVCQAPVVLFTSPSDGATAVLETSPLAVTFSGAMSPASLTAQTTSGPCTGSIQASTDDFATCLAFATAAPTMSLGDTVATLVAAPGLSYGSTFKIRVTTAAAGVGSVALAAQYTSMGFTTGLATSACSGAGFVVISQVYGAGGNAAALFKNDYIELHNRGSVPVSLAGWTVQYAAAASTTWATTALTGTIAAGGYHLIQGVGGNVGANLPTPDDTGVLSLASTAGKVALVNNATPLAGGCPTGAMIVDFVGYGTTASCFEGTGPTPAPSGTLAATRAGAGCTDAGQNATDFTAVTASPRNAASAAQVCTCGGDLTLNESGQPAEADYCVIQFPKTTLTLQTGTATQTIYGRIFEAGLTNPTGAAPGVTAQLGYGPASVNPEWQSGWQFFPATFNVQAGNDDEYQASILAPAPGNYRYAYRFSQNGTDWTYCDANGAGSNGGLSFEVTQLPSLVVTP